MKYQYKYIEEGEKLHWDNIKSDVVDLPEESRTSRYTIARRNNLINLEANKQASVQFMRLAQQAAFEEGCELDVAKALRESLKFKRLVCAVQELKEQKNEHQR
jgi:hypothetical protein